jgi:radical SAM superfamily enzyme YgiQ (UPF0313 family)
MALKIAMVIPPAVDLNTPYAAAPRLAGWLRHLGHSVVSIDASLEIFLRVFSPAGLERMFAAIDPGDLTNDYRGVYQNRERYVQIIDDAVAVLQHRDMAAIYRITGGRWLPEGPHFRRRDVLESRRNAGAWSHGDLARHFVSLMIADLTETFRTTISKHFGVHRYAHNLGYSPPSFDPLAAELAGPRNVYEQMLFELAEELFPKDLDLVCFTCPFPGNVMGSLLLGKWFGANRPGAKRAFGGGFPSTELRELSDPRVFDYVDYVVLDDGELPLQQICERLEGRDAPLHNTFVRESGAVAFHKSDLPAIPFETFPTPSYDGFDMRRYVHVIYRENLVQRASDGTWLKLTAAHGCYWKRCTFCDIHLPYIGDYDPMPAQRLADHMDSLHAQTGLSGFHFTDEAAPPALLINLALELLRRKRSYHWWGNIRYDKVFEPDRCKLLAAAGLIMVTGGIETASDAVLQKIEKGVSVFQLVKVLQAFSTAGIGTHGYLMYGFPGETKQDAIDGLEVIRQLMRMQLLQSGFYHQLSVTAHAPLAKKPALFNIRLTEHPHRGFARNQLPFKYLDDVKRSEAICDRMVEALELFQRGIALDEPLPENWFDGLDMPRPSVAPSFVEDTMKQPHPGMRVRDRVVWLGGVPSWSRGQFSVRASDGAVYSRAFPQTVADALRRCHPDHWENNQPPARSDFESTGWIDELRPLGLVLV